MRKSTADVFLMLKCERNGTNNVLKGRQATTEVLISLLEGKVYI